MKIRFSPSPLLADAATVITDKRGKSFEAVKVSDLIPSQSPFSMG